MNYRHVHLIGIGGAGLSAIARVLLERGVTVSGSDMKLSDLARQLTDNGARIYEGHDAAYVDGADVVVRSSAIPDSNPEVEAALAAGIPVLKRRDFLGELMSGHRVVAVAGAHGKTTTTALLSWLLHRVGQQPGFIVGSVMSNLGVNAQHGEGQPFVIEADEYDYMFLGLHPSIAIVTNLEHDHPDMFPTLDDMKAAFMQFVETLPGEDGLLIACNDDEGARELAEQANVPTYTYGISEGADYRAEDLRLNRLGGTDFLVTKNGETLGLVRLTIPGDHNVRNALAAITVCDYLGIRLSDLLPALREFTGTGRRFEVKGEEAGITVVDDYAHHPTEIRVTLAAAHARYEGRPLWAMFQPHTFSRTRALLMNFASSFNNADHVLVSDIFRSREVDDGSITASDVVREMRDMHPDVRYVGSLNNAVETLLNEMQSGDVLITLGAGDSNTVADRVLTGLRERRQATA